MIFWSVKAFATKYHNENVATQWSLISVGNHGVLCLLFLSTRCYCRGSHELLLTWSTPVDLITWSSISSTFQVLIFVLWCYGLKFLPVILSVLISYGGILSSHCANFCAAQNCTCVVHYSPEVGVKTLGPASEPAPTLLLAQHINVVIVFVHFGACASAFRFRCSG